MSAVDEMGGCMYLCVTTVRVSVKICVSDMVSDPRSVAKVRTSSVTIRLVRVVEPKILPFFSCESTHECETQQLPRLIISRAVHLAVSHCDGIRAWRTRFR
jgi:hypothetical protein